MIKYTITFLSLLAISIYAQKDEWINYTNGDKINSTILVDSILWVGTDGGLVKIDFFSKQTTFYNVANSGLIDNKVNCIVVDSSKKLWIATNEGLCKFDGLYGWTTYSPQNSNFPVYNTYSLKFDRNNNMWIGTLEGLIKFDGNDWKTYFETPYRLIDELEIDKDGNIWIGSMGNLAVSGYLARFNGSTFSEYNTSNSTQHFMQVTSILVDDSNHVWVAHDNGLAKFGDSVWYNFPFYYIKSLELDNDNTLWAGENGGITQIKDGEIKRYDDRNSPIPNDCEINTLLFNKKNEKIIGTISQGLFIWSDTLFNKINTSNSGIPFNEIWGISIDDLNNLWISTATGVAKFDGKDWITYKFDDLGIYGPIFTTNCDKNGNIWIGTWGDGILKFDGFKWINYNSDNSPIPGNVVAEIVISENAVWFGTWGNGLAKFENNKWEIFNTSNSPIPHNYVRSLAIDNQNVLWIGTDNGLASFNGIEWNVFSPEIIWDISIDKYGTKWIATNHSGLLKFDGIKWEVFDKSNSGIVDNYLYTISIDRFNNKWIGTRFSGLIKYDDTSWTSYDIFNSGMPGNLVRAIQFDQYDNIIIGTSGGLAILNYDQAEPSGVQYNKVINSFSLSQNYPNPFNPTTKIKYTIPTPPSSSPLIKGRNEVDFVTLKVYDILGNEITTLVNEEKPTGNYEIEFDGSRLSSGIYFYMLKARENRLCKKMCLVK